MKFERVIWKKKTKTQNVWVEKFDVKEISNFEFVIEKNFNLYEMTGNKMKT